MNLDVMRMVRQILAIGPGNPPKNAGSVNKEEL